MEVNCSDLQLLLHTSMRYAMGRQTYLPSAIQELIKRHREVFTNENLRQLAEEITKEHQFHNGNLGAEMDTRGWLEFRDWLLNTANAGVIFPIPDPIPTTKG